MRAGVGLTADPRYLLALAQVLASCAYYCIIYTVLYKTFVRRSGKVWLRAENPLYPDLIPGSDLQVQGVGRAVIRFLSK